MTKTIIEINGQKLEIDLRQAKRVDTLQVGSRVRVLTKTYTGHAVHHGVVIGFEPFKLLPTIIIAYIIKDYNSAKMEFVYFNSNTKDIEVVAAIDNDEMALDKNAVLKFFERDIATKEREIADLQQKREYFLNEFKQYWEPRTLEAVVAGPAPEADGGPEVF